MTLFIPQAKRPLDIQPLAMTPLDLIGWALAIGIAWSVFTSCVPLEGWITALIAAIKTRRRDKATPDEDDPDPQS